MLVSFRGLFHMKISSTLNSNKRQGSEEEEILGEAVVKVDKDIEVGGSIRDAWMQPKNFRMI